MDLFLELIHKPQQRGRRGEDSVEDVEDIVGTDEVLDVVHQEENCAFEVDVEDNSCDTCKMTRCTTR